MVPCNSDYMRATGGEVESLAVLTYLTELGLDTGPYDSHYGRVSTLHGDTARLCGALKEMTNEQISTKSLELQLWWKRHQEWDRKRETEEQRTAKQTALRTSALSKLTEEEREALGW